MKYLLVFTLLLSLNLFAKRKISNTNYYYCSIERNGELNTNYRSEFVIPLMKEPEEIVIKKSRRWNDVIVKMTTDFKIEVSIRENYRRHEDKKEEVITPEGMAYNNPIPVDKEFKLKINDKDVIYRLVCE